MLNQYIKDPTRQERLRSGPLGPYLDSFAELDVGLGYAFTTRRQQFRYLAEFSRWLVKKQLLVTDLDEETVDEFLNGRRQQGRSGKDPSSAIRRFIGHLRSEDVIPALPESAEDCSALAHLKRRYEDYLRKERGLVCVTADNYLPFIHRFLTERFGSGPLGLAELKPSDISNFVIRHADSMSRKGAQLMVTALRSFLRFIFQYGEIDTNLAVSVLTVADWRLSTVPKYITREQVEKMLAACDLGTSNGRRDFAILLLLARLGLRASEIVNLQLEDIDWREGLITVRGKGLSHDRLPLPSDVGEALASYLRLDRPKTVDIRRVFLCARAPLLRSCVILTILCHPYDPILRHCFVC